jgi:hypothetical protein
MPVAPPLFFGLMAGKVVNDSLVNTATRQDRNVVTGKESHELGPAHAVGVQVLGNIARPNGEPAGRVGDWLRDRFRLESGCKLNRNPPLAFDGSRSLA